MKPAHDNDRSSSPTMPYVLWFADEMEYKLAANRDKGDRQAWLQVDKAKLLDRLFQEFTELCKAVSEGESSARIIQEAADVANFAMMIADHAETFGP